MSEVDLDKLNLYHKIWARIHSQQFQEQQFTKQLDELESIITNQLNFCKCGSDAQFILSGMLNYYASKNYNFSDPIFISKFWTTFHNFIRSKLNQPIVIKA